MRATASKAGLLLSCQFWAREGVEWNDTAGPAAARGTRIHEAVEAAIKTAIIPKLDAPDEAACVSNVLAYVGASPVESEVALAYDPVTGAAQRVEVDGPRGYAKWKALGYICGTADLVRVDRESRRGYVADIKTGDGTRASAQLRTLALMLARAEGLLSVDVEALEVTELGVTVRCRETLDSFDLSAIAGELSKAAASVASSQPKPGPHCADSYCPARTSCPAFGAAVAQLVPAETLTRKLTVRIASPEHALWMHEQLKLVSSAADQIKDAIKAYVGNGVTLSDGRTFEASTRNVTRFDKSAAISLCKALGATDEQLSELEKTVQEGAGLKVRAAKKGKAA